VFVFVVLALARSPLPCFIVPPWHHNVTIHPQGYGHIMLYDNGANTDPKGTRFENQMPFPDLMKHLQPQVSFDA
jgi:hypothetical protein